MLTMQGNFKKADFHKQFFKTIIRGLFRIQKPPGVVPLTLEWDKRRSIYPTTCEAAVEHVEIIRFQEQSERQ